MAIFKKQAKVNETITVEEPKVEEIKPQTTEEELSIVADKIKIKKEVKEEKKTTIKKGAKVTANGRCFGSENLECPLKSVRNYETKILEVSDKSVLIDEGWIAKENIK